MKALLGSEKFRSQIPLVISEVIGSKAFRNYWDKTGRDILEDGRFSCAKVVSAVPNRVDSALCFAEHATVNGLIKDLFESGWYVLSFENGDPHFICDHIPTGAVVIWEASPATNGHRHAGFSYYGNAVSNCAVKRIPVVHGLFKQTDDKTPRNVELILWHFGLGNPFIK